MQFGKALLSSTLLLSAAFPCTAFTHARRGPTSPKLFSKRSKSTQKSAGQRGIDDTRASQIQASLIKSGYLSGEASGHWDARTESAMQKFQEDNGWQTKFIPDSRARFNLQSHAEVEHRFAQETRSPSFPATSRPYRCAPIVKTWSMTSSFVTGKLPALPKTPRSSHSLSQ
jgi:hypothetical protein